MGFTKIAVQIVLILVIPTVICIAQEVLSDELSYSTRDDYLARKKSKFRTLARPMFWALFPAHTFATSSTFDFVPSLAMRVLLVAMAYGLSVGMSVFAKKVAAWDIFSE